GHRRRRRHLTARHHRQRRGGCAGALPRSCHAHAARPLRGTGAAGGGDSEVKPAPFEYVAARDAADAVASLARFGDEAKVLAGGQSLVPMLALRLARPAALVDINRCRDLEGLDESAGTLTLSALGRRRASRRPRPPATAIPSEGRARPRPSCGTCSPGCPTRPSGTAAPPWVISSTPPPPRSCPRCSCASMEA